jgi:hypothetical protein
MSRFRFHLDFEFPEDYTQEQAISFVRVLEDQMKNTGKLNLKLVDRFKVTYRLGNDEDRQKSNYLDINDNGHVSHKKSVWVPAF